MNAKASFSGTERIPEPLMDELRDRRPLPQEAEQALRSKEESRVESIRQLKERRPTLPGYPDKGAAT